MEQWRTQGGIQGRILPKLPCIVPQRDRTASATSSQPSKYITWVTILLHLYPPPAKKTMKFWEHHWKELTVLPKYRVHYNTSNTAVHSGVQGRRPASADRTARRQFQATGQPVSRTQASDAMTSRYRAMGRSVCNAGASNRGRSICVQISREPELPPANILIPLERQLIALQPCCKVIFI